MSKPYNIYQYNVFTFIISMFANIKYIRERIEF